MKCANFLCSSEELYFRSGTLHAIDCEAAEFVADQRVVRQKVIWLCDQCSQDFIVDTWRPPGQQLHARNEKRLQAGSQPCEGDSDISGLSSAPSAWPVFAHAEYGRSQSREHPRRLTAEAARKG